MCVYTSKSVLQYANFKFNIFAEKFVKCKLKKDINSAIKLSLGVALTTNQSRDYWTEIRKINNAKTCQV